MQQPEQRIQADLLHQLINERTKPAHVTFRGRQIPLTIRALKEECTELRAIVAASKSERKLELIAELAFCDQVLAQLRSIKHKQHLLALAAGGMAKGADAQLNRRDRRKQAALRRAK